MGYIRYVIQPLTHNKKALQESTVYLVELDAAGLWPSRELSLVAQKENHNFFVKTRKEVTIHIHCLIDSVKLLLSP